MPLTSPNMVKGETRRDCSSRRVPHICRARVGQDRQTLTSFVQSSSAYNPVLPLPDVMAVTSCRICFGEGAKLSSGAPGQRARPGARPYQVANFCLLIKSLLVGNIRL